MEVQMRRKNASGCGHPKTSGPSGEGGGNEWRWGVENADAAEDEEGRIRGVPGGGQVPMRATTPKPEQKAGADPATAEGRRGAEQAEHLQWCRL